MTSGSESESLPLSSPDVSVPILCRRIVLNRRCERTTNQNYKLPCNYETFDVRVWSARMQLRDVSAYDILQSVSQHFIFSRNEYMCSTSSSVLPQRTLSKSDFPSSNLYFTVSISASAKMVSLCRCFEQNSNVDKA